MIAIATTEGKSKACVNLKERFGKRYRVEYEESFYAERSRGDDPWLQIIPCKYGHLFPWGGNLLAVSVDGFPRIARSIARLECFTVRQDGDDGELTATFDVSDLPKVAKVMRPRQKRRMSAERRSTLANQGRRALEDFRQRNVQVQYSGAGGRNVPLEVSGVGRTELLRQIRLKLADSNLALRFVRTSLHGRPPIWEVCRPNAVGVLVPMGEPITDIGLLADQLGVAE